MKIKLISVRSLVSTVLFGAFTTIVNAGPGLKHWQTLGKESQFKELNSGMTVAFVCNACKSISGIPIKSKEQAIGYCKEGGKVICPSCKLVARVVVKRARNDAPTHTEVRYVNDKGEDCAFMAVAPKNM